MQPLEYIVNTDGGARGNPGPAGAGIVIQTQTGEILSELKKSLGTLTNNQAEYWGVIFALEELKQFIVNDIAPVRFHLDSLLVVEQLKGNYKIKNEGLKPLFWKVKTLIDELGVVVSFKHIPRRENTRADELANQAMDEVDRSRT
ncbi:ribonuclease HI family protein [Candidatus Berkelbacteria bacterium]|nr:ribonuclease HI family protein [Candidatus Berkelbacteria bacterium]